MIKTRKCTPTINTRGAEAVVMASSTLDERRERKEGSALVKTHLLAYNGAMVAGWAFLLVKTIQFTVAHVRSPGETPWRVTGLYDAVRWPLLVFQTAALLEVFHSLLGFVRSGVMTTLIQVYSRIFVTWAVIEGVPGVSGSIGLLLVVYAWAITEVVRYSFYFFGLLGSVPYAIKWCRYTLFFVLYPTGVLGEQLMLFAALPVVHARDQWAFPLPNTLNISFSYYYFLWITIFGYIPIFPQLYGHMIQQRKKVIGGAKPKAD